MQIRCIVKAKSKVDSITVNPDHSLRVKIKTPPVDGKANQYLVEYLADVFGLSKTNIQIISGFTSSHKRINIVGEETHVQKIISKLKLK